jgi:mRNA-degrading endonuclease toxin of MazEF toxin-antitoxin module
MTDKYNELNTLNEKSRGRLEIKATEKIQNLKVTDYQKFLDLITFIPDALKISFDSKQLNRQRMKIGKEKGQHPLKPIRGQIYNAYLGENVGTELSGQHPVIIVQNIAGNLFSQKVNVIPIEGDGNNVKEPYQMQITSADLENGRLLSKDPSRIILSDILTIDKARLGVKVGKIKDGKMKLINESLIRQLSLDNEK